MVIQGDQCLALAEIPDSDLSVMGAGDHFIEDKGAFLEYANSVGVALEGGDEGFGKYFL